MSITPLPPPPNRATDSPQDFTNKADAFLNALPSFQEQANSLANEVQAHRNETYNWVNNTNSKLGLVEQANTTNSAKVESIELLLQAGGAIGDTTDFMLSVVKNAADNANNHLQLKFQLMEKGVI